MSPFSSQHSSAFLRVIIHLYVPFRTFEVAVDASASSHQSLAFIETPIEAETLLKVRGLRT